MGFRGRTVGLKGLGFKGFEVCWGSKVGSKVQGFGFQDGVLGPKDRRLGLWSASKLSLKNLHNLMLCEFSLVAETLSNKLDAVYP